MTGEHDLLRLRLEALWIESASQVAADRVVFDKARWQALNLSEQRALLREAVRHLRPDLRNLDFTPLERALRFSRTAQAGRRCDLLGGLCLSLSPAHVTVSAWAAEPAPADIPLLDAQGQLSDGWKFRTETLGPGAWALAEIEANARDWNMYVDAGRVRELRLRPRRPGDRIQPLGLRGHSLKVSDLMINAKMDARVRDRWPLVVCGDAIVWVPGLRLDERFKVMPETTTVMRLWLEKSESSESEVVKS
jgi:tRNA(Ile)-lysidine synthase